MSKKAQSKPGAGRKAEGNIVIDLGEKLDRKLQAAGMAGVRDRGGVSRFGSTRFGSGTRLGSYRPGSYGGYRPSWYPSRGGASKFELGLKKMGVPQTLVTEDLVAGLGLGTVGNRIIARVLPMITPVGPLTGDAIAAGVGIIPFLANPNSMTVGVAVPGLIALATTLADELLNMIGLMPVTPAPAPVPVVPVVPVAPAAPAATAPAVRGAMSAAMAARQKLADIQNRLARPAQPAFAPYRVQARPAYAG